MSRVISAITGHEYDDDNSKVVYYKNAKESAFFINHGATLLDLISTDDNYFIFVFSRDDHRKYINAWNATRPAEVKNEKVSR